MTKQAPPSVDELIARARAGDNEARDKLFAWCSKAMHEWATRRLAKKQPGIARPSDIAQDAAMQAVRAFSSFRGNTEAEWMAWLEAIVHTCTVQSFRDAGRQKRDHRKEVPLEAPDVASVPAPQTSPSQATADEEQWRQVLGRIFELPHGQRQAIWLCHLKRIGVADVATRMGKSPAAVAGLLQRGLESLRERFSTESEKVPGMATPSARGDTSAALLAYLRRREANQTIPIDSFVAEHPSCANELRTLLLWIARIEALEPKNPDEDEGD